MSWLEALLLGVLQGLTEFLPVSSSGHLELGKALFGVDPENSLLFTVVVHGATVLSTIVVFRRDLARLIAGSLKFRWNEETRYVLLLLWSMLPVLIVGLFFKAEVESLFSGRIVFVGTMLIVTALLLGTAHFIPKKEGPIRTTDALIIGLAQALAVIPGISRSGATIATALLLGKDKRKVARFSFLMVLLPIIGANMLDLGESIGTGSLNGEALPLVMGFIAAFLTGWLACRWMVALVEKGKLLIFALYCLLIGSLAIIFA
jgi:undecaprenyl-diphosphatase